MNPNDITTSPPLRFRIVNKNTKEEFHFLLDEICGTGKPDDNLYIMPGLCEERVDFGGALLFRDCHPPDLSTGHYDAEGKEVFGGDIRYRTYPSKHYVLTYWEDDGWFSLPLGVDWGENPLAEDAYDDNVLEYDTVIGNIHNASALPEEVRRMLE